MPRTGPGTKPQCERRRGAKACKIAGKSEPNRSPGSGEPGGISSVVWNELPTALARRMQQRTPYTPYTERAKCTGRGAGEDAEGQTAGQGGRTWSGPEGWGLGGLLAVSKEEETESQGG